MKKSTLPAMLNPPLLLLLMFIAITTPSTSARPLHSSDDHTITFFMNDVLGNSLSSSAPAARRTDQLPLHGPEAIFTPKGAVPRPSPSARNAGAPVSWLSLLTNLQALESGTVTVVEEEPVGGVAAGLSLAGKVQGVYVTSSDDESSRMVAMKATFINGELEDSLRLFGVHQPGGISESHIAVVGGTGRYHGANGFAVVKAVGGERKSKKKELLFTVHLN